MGAAQVGANLRSQWNWSIPGNNGITRWLKLRKSGVAFSAVQINTLVAMIKLSFPFTEEKIRALKVGDEVLISGVVFTGRDAVHKYLHEGGKLPPGVSFKDGIIYHCGPVMMQQPDGSWINTNSRWMEGDPNLVTGYALLSLSYCRPEKK